MAGGQEALTIDQPQLERWLKKWQAVLRLQDWHIAVEIKRDRDMDGALGRTNYRRKTKEGVIRILSPLDANPNTLYPTDHDYELTLVHELLHFHFAPFYVPAPDDPDETDAVHVAQELAIDLIAGALVKLDRSRNSS